LKEEGRAGSIGVSYFAVPHLERIIGETGVTPAVNQIELHPRFQQRELRAFHDAHGIKTESWSPLGHGTGLQDPVLAGIAQRHGKTIAQVVMRWHIDSGLIVIPKTVRRARMDENRDVFDFRLIEDDMAQITMLDSVGGGSVPTRKRRPFRKGRFPPSCLQARTAIVSEPSPPDLAIIGGGLAGGLIALAFAARHPDLKLLLIEADDRLGGNHIWSFFDGDVKAQDRWLVDPMIAHRWPEGHDVRFPGFARTLTTPYNSISSERFDAHLRARLGEQVWSGATVANVEPQRVTLADGRTVEAGAVIDARGGDDLSALSCGWQKFVGQALTLAKPHGLTRPVIMDASVGQLDGYRFVYVLPFDDRTLFVEDTYYSDIATLDADVVRGRIAAYSAAQGWQIEAVSREETGVLPVVTGGNFDAFWTVLDPVARAGVRAGLFHPTTGYSLPDAVDFALWIATAWPLKGDALATASRTWAKTHWKKGGYYRLLDRMLFRAAAPAQRYRIFARFYRLSPGLIGRFYAGRSTTYDKLRILCGRPPVPIRKAMQALSDSKA
jgi:lycopene beta-cyclase